MQFGVWKRIIAGFTLILAHAHVLAIDSVAIEMGVGDRVQIAHLGVQWDWGARWFQSNGAHLGGYWDLSLSQWRGTSYRGIKGDTQQITSIGLTPVFRIQRDNKKGAYLEGGVGMNLLSDLYDNNNHHLSTRFQFGPNLGIGYVFDNKVDIGLRYQHYSNASIKQPNDGVDVIAVRTRYAF